ncbi:MAG: hypothetical protein WCR31_04740 [Treponema sp.]
MTKAKFLKIVNPLLAVDFLCLIGTALLDDVIPREIYGVIHPVFGYIFAVGLIVHVFLNWNWIKTTYFKKKS